MALPPIVEVPQEQIIVTRDARQRTDLDPDGVAKLAADIRRHGLLNAIIVEDTNDEDSGLVRVIAGERRLAACRSLGWSHIPCRFWSELSPLDRQRLEWARYRRLPRSRCARASTMARRRHRARLGRPGC